MKIQEKDKNIVKIKTKNPFKSLWNGVPATARHSLSDTSLYETFFLSFFGHVMGFLLIALIIFCFNIWGITPILFPKPQTKVRDIEFVLKNRHIHHIVIPPKVEEVQPPPTVIPQKTESKPQDFGGAKSISKTPMPAQTPKGNNGKGSSKQAAGQHSQSSTVPGFSMSMPNLKSLSSGLGHSGSSKGHALALGASGPSIGDIENAFSSGKSSSSAAGFDKSAAKKMIAPYDISPYVNELKRNIRWNWRVPKESENKRVELFLRIAKDGKIIILNVKRTSESAATDNAALDAVRRCQPLNPLPAKYPKGYLDVVFTFGSNSVGSRY